MKNNRDGNIDWLTGGGQMADVIRAHDWSKTSLGPIEEWSLSLRIAVSLCLKSLFPTVIYWGSEYLTIYNDRYILLLGEKHPWALGRSAREVWAEVWVDHNEQKYKNVFEAGVPTWAEDRFLVIRRNGFLEECYMTYSYGPILVEGDKVGGIFCICHESTERVLTERRLALYRDLGKTVSTPKTVEEICESCTQLLTTNPGDISFAQIFLVDPDGKNFRLVSTVGSAPSTESEPQLNWSMTSATKNGRTEFVELIYDMDYASIKNKTHTAIILPLSKFGVLVAGLSPRLPFNEKYASFFQVISSQIATAISHAKDPQVLNEAEESRSESFHHKREREILRESIRMRDEFLSVASHELKTPITSLSLQLQMTRRRIQPELGVFPTPDKLVRAIDTSLKQTMRLSDLVEELLDYSKIQLGVLDLNSEEVDVGLFISEICERYRGILANSNCALSVQVPVQVKANWDVSRIEQVLVSLFSNVIKYAPGSPLNVIVTDNQESATIEVQDFGPGIPADRQSKIFERFERASASKIVGGLGLGLYIAKKIVGAHQGEIHVESDLGQGAKFVVRLPLHPVMVSAEPRFA